MPFPWDGSSFSSSLLILLSVILMGISAFKPHSFEGVRTYVSDLFFPALALVSLPFQHISIFLHDVTGLAQLQADNLRLKQENIKLREWYQTALLLDSENKTCGASRRYSRIVKLGTRRFDAAEMCFLELVEAEMTPKKQARRWDGVSTTNQNLVH